MDAPEKRRWYCPTPGWLVFGSMAVTGLLFLSERWRWFPFNEHKGWTVLVAVAGVGVVLGVMLLWWLVALIFRWRFQFSIRTLLVLTLVVALPCSWLAVTMGKARTQANAWEEIRKLGGHVGLGPNPNTPERLYDLFGHHFFREPVQVLLNDSKGADAALEYFKQFTAVQQVQLNGSNVSDAGLANLKGLTDLQHLSLCDTQVTDAGLDNLKYTPALVNLWLDNTQVSDAGIENFNSLRALKSLLLRHSKVTDAGLVNLKGLTALEQLSLDDTQVTNAGLEDLGGLTELRYLSLLGTKVTDGGVAKLRKALPNCYIQGP
jgi:hypothetical protein